MPKSRGPQHSAGAVPKSKRVKIVQTPERSVVLAVDSTGQVGAGFTIEVVDGKLVIQFAAVGPDEEEKMGVR